MKKPTKHKAKPSLGKGPGKIGKDMNMMRHAQAMAMNGNPKAAPSMSPKMKKAKKKA